ncbi:MAG: FUSC family protein [Roseibium sp.]|uniref:FUSC family protein n=1 Tax=Roseibium sp. TaxID=1936156 RepID=UPI001B18BF89|nr:FUSC family protein [Roseibium sp.]MBO6892400.1 FUSC family protein [Roseibium sp.]MBO6928666.1 FUSC family protein [Roseibium sp.]
MLRLMSAWFEHLSRFDPGALRLVRGIHLMLTVVVAAYLASLLAQSQSSISAFSMSVLAAASGAHCLLFTPIATRRQEAHDILRLGCLMTGLFGIGALVGSIAADQAPEVLKITWIMIIAFGFSLDGLGPFGARAGRMIAIGWLFVIMSSQPHSPGIWLPLMAILGVAVALLVRIGLWRPDPVTTYGRIETRLRNLTADDIEACQGSLSGNTTPPLSPARMTELRKELRLCSDLMTGDGTVKGMSPETAAMTQLALEVVHDAMSGLSVEARRSLDGSKGFAEATRHLVRNIRGEKTADTVGIDLAWAHPDREGSRKDAFHTLRIAQAYKRLLVAVRTRDPLAVKPDTAAGGAGLPWWQRLSWWLALQAGAAAALAYAIGTMFELSHAYWITLTVIVILCSNLGPTAQKTFQRTAGTAIGVLVAMSLSPLLAKLPEMRTGLVLIAIPVILVFIERSYTVAAGIISFVVVVGLQALEGVSILELWSRIYDTVIGACLGLGAAWVLFPKRSGAGLQELSGKFLRTCAEYLQVASTDGEENRSSYLDLRRDAANLKATVKTYRIEQAPWSSVSSSANGLDVLVIVLADYVVLYRQVHASVLAEASADEAAAEIAKLIVRLDARIQEEFRSVLAGEEARKTDGLSDEWMAALPVSAFDNPDLLADWVAMLYYARKIIRCIERLRQDAIWSEAFRGVSVKA